MSDWLKDLPPGSFDMGQDEWSDLPDDAFDMPVAEVDRDQGRMLGMLLPEARAQAKSALLLAPVLGTDAATAHAMEPAIRQASDPQATAQNVLQYWGEGVSNGMLQSEYGELGFKQWTGDDSTETDARIKDIMARIKPEGAQWQKWWLTPLRAVRWGLEMAPTMIQGFGEGGAKGLGLAGAAALAGLPFEAAPGPGTVAHAGSIAVAAGIGMTEGTLENIFRKETGGAYIEFGGIMDANGEVLDPTTRRVAAVAVGILNTGLEALQIGKLFPGLSKAVTGLGIKMVQRGAFAFLKDVTVETVQEAMQEAVNVLMGELAREIQETIKGVPVEVTNIISGENLKAGVSRVMDTAVRSLGAFMVTMGVSRGAARIAGMRGEATEHPIMAQARAEEAARTIAIEETPTGEIAQPMFAEPATAPVTPAVAEPAVAAQAAEMARVSFAEAVTTLDETVAEAQDYIGEGMDEVDAQVEQLRGLSEELTTADEPGRAVVLEKFKTTKAQRLAVELRKTVREATGQTKVSEVYVDEKEALEAAFQKAQRYSKQGFAAGKQEEAARNKITLKERRRRDTIRSRVARIKKDLTAAVKDTHEGTAQGDAIRDIVDGIDLVTRRQTKTLTKLQATREFLTENEDAELPDYVVKKLGILDKTPMDEMTLDELEAAHDAGLHQVHLTKTKDRILVGKENRRKADVLARVISEMKPAPEQKAGPASSELSLKERLPGKWLLRQLGLRSNHYDLIIERIAGPNSTIDKVAYREIKKGVKTKQRYIQGVDREFATDLSAVKFSRDVDKWRQERVQVGGQKFTRGERIEVYLNSLNENNRRSMLEKRPAFASNRTNQFTMTEADLEAMVASLTPEEKAVADAMRKAYKKQGVELSKVHYQKNGYPMRIVDEYAPKNVNTLAAGILDEEKTDILEQLKGKWIRLGLDKGMLVERTGSATPLLIRDAFETFAESVDRAGTYIGLEIPLSNASKLLYDKPFQFEMERRYGKYLWKEIETGLRDIAGEYKAQSDFVDGAVKNRARLTKAIFTLNPFPAAKVILSYPLFGAYVDASHMGRGLMEYLASPKDVIETHKQHSPEFLARVEKGFNRDISEVVGRGTQGKRLTGKRISEMSMMRFLDRNTVAAGMQGAVLQALDEFQAGQLTPMTAQALDMKDADIARMSAEEKVAKAYEYADYVVERTQDMSAPEHQSPIQRGDFVEKTVSMFSTSTNQMLNLARRMMDQSKRTGDFKPVARAMLVLGIAMMGNSGIDSIRDHLYKRKKKASFLERAVNEVSGMFYLARDVMQTAMSRARLGAFSSQDISAPPLRILNLAAEFGGNVLRAAQRGSSKAAKEALDNFIELLAITTGKIPYTGLRSIYRSVTGGR